jgi:hypothetical protein
MELVRQYAGGIWKEQMRNLLIGPGRVTSVENHNPTYARGKRDRKFSSHLEIERRNVTTFALLRFKVFIDLWEVLVSPSQGH